MLWSIAVHPSGKYAYLPNWNSNNVSQFTIDPNSGEITAMSAATVATGKAPLTLAVAPSGK